MERKHPPVIYFATSKRFYAQARELVGRLKQAGITVFHPYFDLDARQVDADPGKKQDITLRHFRELDQCDTVYALLPGGYIGISVTMEITYAYARGKTIICSEPPAEFAVRAMIDDTVHTAEFIARFENGLSG